MTAHVSELLKLIATDEFPTIRAALNNQCAQSPRNYDQPTLVEKPGRFVLYNIKSVEFSVALFELFRNHSRWLLHGGYTTATAREQDFVVEVYQKDGLSVTLPSDGFVYHVTEAAEAETILKSGLKPGHAVGKTPRDKRFQESSYYM
jgi:hypothetical protein